MAEELKQETENVAGQDSASTGSESAALDKIGQWQERFGEDAATETTADSTADVVDAAPAKSAPSIGFDMRARAYAAGMTDGDIAALSTPESFGVALRIAESRAKSADPAPKADEKPAEDDLEFKLDIDPDSTDPTVVKALESMSKHYAAIAKRQRDEISTVKGVLTSSQKAAAEASGREAVRKFDLFRSNLGDEGKALLGTKPLTTMDPAGADTQACLAVLEKAALLEQVYAQNGKSASEEQLFREAMYLVHGESLTKMARESERKAIEKKVSARKNGFTSPPGSGRLNALSDKERALTNGKPNPEAVMDKIGDFLRNRGIME